MAEQQITIRTRVELAALQKLETELETNIAKTRVLGGEFGHLEQQLGKVQTRISQIPQGSKISGGLMNAAQQIPGVGGLMSMASSLSGPQAIFAAGSVAAIKFTKDANDAIKQINAVGRETGITTDTIQNFALKFSDMGKGSAESNAALRSFNMTLGEAAVKGGKAQKVFDFLGVSIANEKGYIKDTEVVLREALDAISKIDSESVKAAISSKLFGDSGELVAKAWKGGSAALDEYSKKSEDLRVSSEDLKSAEVAQKTLLGTLNNYKTRLTATYTALLTGDLARFAKSAASLLGANNPLEESAKIYQKNLETSLATGNASKVLTAEERKRIEANNKITDELLDQYDALKMQEQATRDLKEMEDARKQVDANTEKGKFKSVDDIIKAGDAGKLTTPEQKTAYAQAKLAKEYEDKGEQSRGVNPAESSKNFRLADVVKGRIGSLATAAKPAGDMPLPANSGKGMTQKEAEDFIMRSFGADPQAMRNTAQRDAGYQPSAYEKEVSSVSKQISAEQKAANDLALKILNEGLTASKMTNEQMRLYLEIQKATNRDIATLKTQVRINP